MQYLQELSLLMIKEDRAAGIAEDDGEDGEVQYAGFLRSLPPHQRRKFLRHLRETAI